MKTKKATRAELEAENNRLRGELEGARHTIRVLTDTLVGRQPAPTVVAPVVMPPGPPAAPHPYIGDPVPPVGPDVRWVPGGYPGLTYEGACLTVDVGPSFNNAGCAPAVPTGLVIHAGGHPTATLPKSTSVSTH